MSCARSGLVLLHLPTMAATREITIELLRDVPLFSSLADDELTQIAEMASPDRYEPEEIVFREGESSTNCYVIRSGHAWALREHSGGRVITLARFGPGDIFGELAMLDQQRRSATIQALDELEVIVFLGPEMR